MKALIPIAVVGVLALIVWAAIASHKKTKERKAALLAWAGANGWRYAEPRDTRFDERHAHFSQFRQGHSRVLRLAIEGDVTINERPHRLTTGDFQYKTTTTDSKGRTTTTTHNFTFLLLGTPYPQLPALTIRRENFFDKIGSVFGFDDIDFEDAEFSKKFMVKSKDRRFAYDLCSVRMIEFLKEHAIDAPAIHFEQGELLLATSGIWWNVGEFESTLDFAKAFVDRWPDHMLAELENDSGFRTGIET